LFSQAAEDLDGYQLGILSVGLANESQYGFASLRYKGINAFQRALSLKIEFAHVACS
jgi:hypothetical protein